MSLSGDWICGACQHTNFKRRSTCQRCGFSNYNQGQVNASVYGYSTSSARNNGVLAGDWYCQVINCGAHNYASRGTCYRCTALKPEHIGLYNSASYAGAQGAIPGWKIGDWICPRPGCGLHNYACRTECYKCKTPRNYASTSNS